MTNPTQIKSYYAASIIFDMLSSKAKIMYEAIWNENTDEDDIIDLYYKPNEHMKNILDFSVCMSKSTSEIIKVSSPKFYFREYVSEAMKKMLNIDDPWGKLILEIGQ